MSDKKYILRTDPIQKEERKDPDLYKVVTQRYEPSICLIYKQGDNDGIYPIRSCMSLELYTLLLLLGAEFEL